MKILIVSTFYSIGMGYAENCLPRALAKLGHEVHVVSSNLNVYGNDADYAENYEGFLGPAEQSIGTFEVDGYTLHRLPHALLFGYVLLEDLIGKISEIKPDIVHCLEIASIQTYQVAFVKPLLRYKIFTETHQHLSVVKPYLKVGFHPVKRMIYWLTRTLPTSLASIFVEKCYAIAPDCVEVARRFYGVPVKKLILNSLGSDTHLFHSVTTADEINSRRELRARLGYDESDIVCVYTGRFTEAKNPYILAQAIDHLSKQNITIHALFVGEGGQRQNILACANTQILPFMTHAQLADLYRACDIGVWPRQESMSMLDAAASGLPLIVSDQVGEPERVEGNGLFYQENLVDSLIEQLNKLTDRSYRELLGLSGREKMLKKYSWSLVAEGYVADYNKVIF